MSETKTPPYLQDTVSKAIFTYNPYLAAKPGIQPLWEVPAEIPRVVPTFTPIFTSVVDTVDADAQLVAAEDTIEAAETTVDQGEMVADVGDQIDTPVPAPAPKKRGRKPKADVSPIVDAPVDETDNVVTLVEDDIALEDDLDPES